jgi:hypothetical protein
MLNSEFQANGSNYLLVSTRNPVFQPYIGCSWKLEAWQLLDSADISHGPKHDRIYGYLIDHLQKGNRVFTIGDSNLLLDSDEFIKYQSPHSVHLNEARAVRVSNSRHVGSRVRGGYMGASYGVGASQSISQSYDEIRTVDVGQITVTNKRLVFSGEKKSVNVDFKKIISITPYSDGIKLERKGKQKVEYFTNLDDYIFTREHGGEIYFFSFDGNMLKALVEGSLDGLKHISNLQLYDAQSVPKPRKLSSGILESFEYDDMKLEYSKSWKRVEGTGNNILSLEKDIDGVHCSINITKEEKIDNMEFFKSSMVNVHKRANMSTFGFTDIKVNGIDMSTISLLVYKNGILVESIFTYFSNDENMFSASLVHDLYGSAKDDYFNLINSIKIDSISPEDNGYGGRFCYNCGAEIEPDSKFCINCGLKLE